MKLKQKLKNWLLGDEIKALHQKLTQQQVELLHLNQTVDNLPTMDHVCDEIDQRSFVSQDDVYSEIQSYVEQESLVSEDRLEDEFVGFVHEEDLSYRLDDFCFVTEDDVNAAINNFIDNDLKEHTNNALQEIISDVVLQAVKELPSYLLYEKVSGYVEEEYVNYEIYKENIDKLRVQILEVLDKHSSDAIHEQVDDSFFNNFKASMLKLLKDKDE